MDEILGRVMEKGLLDGNRKKYNPDVIRVGRATSIRTAVKDNISLDVLVDVSAVLCSR